MEENINLNKNIQMIKNGMNFITLITLSYMKCKSQDCND